MISGRPRRHHGTRRAAALLGTLVLAAALPCVATEAPRHPLWRVQGQAGTVYLLGSLHVLRAEDYPLPAPLEAAFEDAEITVFETDIEALETPAAQMELMTRAVLPEGETLGQHLSPAIYSRLMTYLNRSGLPADLVRRLKPSMVALTIEVLELGRHGLDPRWGVDKHFHARARARGKRIVFLESVEFQLGLITSLSPQESEALLDTTLDKLDHTDTSLAALLEAWKSGDAGALESLVNEPMRESPALHARLITDRNKRWIDPIVALLRGTDDAVVIVGAAHLVGEDGVVDLLRRRGFDVVQQ